MNYHNITYPDMLNGDGLRVVLWLSGCSHNCYKCQNPQTHNPSSGILFDEKEEEELFRELGKDYISGLTLTGGDPLHENNLDEVLNLVNKIRLSLPEKNIWLYTGYTLTVEEGLDEKDDFWNDEDDTFTYLQFTPKTGSPHDYKRRIIAHSVDVIVDGRYIDSQRDISLKWRGSSNQRCIDVKQTLKKGEIVLWAT